MGDGRVVSQCRMFSKEDRTASGSPANIHTRGVFVGRCRPLHVLRLAPSRMHTYYSFGPGSSSAALVCEEWPRIPLSTV